MGTNKKFINNTILLFIIVFGLLFSSCEQESNVNPENKGSINIGITDTRVSQSKKNSIVDNKLTKFEITISSIQLKNATSGYTTIFENEHSVDLRQFRGKLKDLAQINIPLRKYSGLEISISRIKIEYAGNEYSSSVNGDASLSLAELPGMVFNSAQGVPNYLSSEMRFNIPFDFELTEENNVKNIRIQLDVLPSCKEISFDCPICSTPQVFAGLNNGFFFSIIFEEGIQQIKHSPPLGIDLSDGSDINYYGIHTFMDFNSIGGKINSHTSQHVYRGEDGSLLIDLEQMETNNSPLIPSIITATGETDVRADEIFHYGAYKTKLESLGYHLNVGTTYYFSLRKTWNISSENNTCEITRLCEPLPVVWH